MTSKETVIPLARPSIGDAERSAAQRVLSGTQLTNGSELLRFENLIAEWSQRPYAVAVSSGTSALELSLWALDIGPGDNVLVTAFGFPAAANAVRARGAETIAIDVEADTWCMDFTLAKKAVDGNTKAIVTIDSLGAVTSSEAIEALQAETGLPVISDAACGFAGKDEHGSLAGAAGQMATFSFHPRKLITTGEGGAIVCSDEAIAIRLRQLRNHGQVGGGVFASIGTNARLGELACAIGCAQIARLPPMLAERRMLVEGYKERLGALKAREQIQWQDVGAGVHANQSFSMLLSDPAKREQLLVGLRAQGIECGVATYCFTDLGIHEGSLPCPMASRRHDGAISLPLYLGMRSAELSRVCESVEQILS